MQLDPANWAKWKAQLARRKPIRLPGDKDRDSALLWGTADCLDLEGRALLKNIHRALQTAKAGTLAKTFDRWFAAAARSPSVQTALEAIAWARALPALAQVVEGEAWCSALDSLHALAAGGDDGIGDQALVFQLLRVELAATLARQFSELSFAASLSDSVQGASGQLLQAVLDDDGLPASDRLSLVRPLWASWVRCRQLESAGSEIFDEPSRGRVDKFFRQALRLTRTDGSPVLGGPTTDAALLAATEQAAATPTTRRVVAAVRGALAGGSEKGLPHPPWYSEKRGLAVLRTRWSPLVDQATVRFFAAETDVEWQAGGRVLGSGPWSWQATVNGQPLTTDGNWEEVCWHSDADVDYLELELPLSGGWALQRQILLGRLDRFLYLADVLVGNDAKADEQAELRFTSSWPLSEGLRFEGAKETRDGFFVAGGKRLASATPLAMPEWRTEFYPAELAANDGELQVSAAGRGKNLYCPLWIDLDSRRAQQPLTWRRLTVGEELETVKRDVAVGYRMQCGAQQWLVYRSLGEKGNRTVLGQNYSTEFVVCRFQRDGQTVDLIEIQ